MSITEIFDEDGGATMSPAEADRPDAGGPVAGPRTRWAAIVWGLVFAAIATAGISLASDADRFDELIGWMAALEAGTALGYGLLGVGVLVLIVGLVGLLRRAQVALAARRSDGAAPAS